MRPLLRSSAWLLWLSAAGFGCGPLELSRGLSDAGSPDASEPVLVLTEAGTLVSGAFPAGSAPKVAFDTPTAGSRVAGASVKITGHASDDYGVASVMLRSGGNSQVLATSHDSFKTFEAEVSALPGSFVVEAVAFDLAGQASLPEQLQLIGGDSGADSAAPTLRISSPADGSSPLQLLALVEGEAEDDLLVDSMSVTRNGERLDERLFGTSDNFRHWSRLVPLLPGELNTLVFTARDRAGHETQATLTLRARANTDREPPVVTITAPAAAMALDTDRLDVRGTATDNVAVREVKVRLLTKVGSETVRGDFVTATTS
ncbi:MAG: Glucodextranase, domain, partial [Pseudomonadota bacterium]